MQTNKGRKLFIIMLAALAFSMVLSALAPAAGAATAPVATPASVCDAPILFQTNIGWVQLNLLVVLFSVTLAGAMYAVSHLLPTQRSERLKRISRYELFEAIVSIIIIAVLFSLASFSCNVGALLVNQQSYTNLFTLANAYLGSLLFTNGVSLLSSFYQTSLNFVIASNVVLFVTQTASQFASALFSAVSVGGIVSLKPGGAIEFVLMSYSGMVTGTYSGLMVVAFAPLYLLFLILPVIKAGALAVVVPVALLIRSLSFVGPKLREASNLFLALAIGFYFVLPLTIVFNIYVASCLHIGLVSSINMPSCRGYDRWTQYLTPYVLPITTSNLFSSTGQSLTTGSSIPLVGNINLLSAYGFNLANPIPGLAGGATSVWNTVWSAPQIAADQATKIAVYLFLGVLMLGLDLAVTAGFINGLGKGLNALANIFGLESFWGD